ncbi:hypothetical protein, partial [Salinicola sp. MIT1003]|uniref:hypothetical protein n=1 Tax=Salinicola sp. MIT1003 TaxID=1882734 RepID=UPI001B356C63
KKLPCHGHAGLHRALFTGLFFRQSVTVALMKSKSINNYRQLKAMPLLTEGNYCFTKNGISRGETGNAASDDILA